MVPFSFSLTFSLVENIKRTFEEKNFNNKTLSYKKEQDENV